MQEFLKHIGDFDIRFRASPVDPMTFAWRLIRILMIVLVIGWAAGNFLHIEFRAGSLPLFSGGARSVPSSEPQRAN